MISHETQRRRHRVSAIQLFTFVTQGLLAYCADEPLAKMLDRADDVLHMRDARLENVLLAKAGGSSLSKPTVAASRPAMFPVRAQNYRGRGVHRGSEKRASFPKGDSFRSNLAHGLDDVDDIAELEAWKKPIVQLRRQMFANALAVSFALAPNSVWAAVDTRFTQADKAGFIGGIASVLEYRLDQVHDGLESFGVTSNTYGISILLFTLFVRMLALPLTYIQTETVIKTQQLAPLREKINAAFPDKSQETEKAQKIGQLFAAGGVNPLAGLLPGLVQFPVLISLYRTLSNLVAEGKLKESFLWLPSLEGPIYGDPKSDWFTSIFSGQPTLGWDDTVKFLSLQAILVITQSASSKLLQPPRSPDSVMTDQERQSQAVVAFLPFLVAYFSTSVPAGLSIYWIASNLLVTSITLGLRKSIKPGDLPPEVQEVMSSVQVAQERALASTQTLVYASATGNLTLVESLLKEGKDPNEADEGNRTVLHFAAGSPAGSKALINALITARANVDVVDGLGNTPLCYAAGYGRKDIVEVLLDAGASLTLNSVGQSPADVARINPIPNEVRDDEALMARLEVNGSAGAVPPPQMDPARKVRLDTLEKAATTPQQTGQAMSAVQERMQQAAQLASSGDMQKRFLELRNDPDLKPVFEELDRAASESDPEAARARLAKFYQNPEIMKKLTEKMQDATKTASRDLKESPSAQAGASSEADKKRKELESQFPPL